MKKTYESTMQTIGDTPLVKIKKLCDSKANILAKLENFNPCGSVKDRIAKYMIEDAEANGKIKHGTVIVEPTSGNTGIGLAFICAAKGYELILTMPESMSIERRKLLSMLGAEIVLTEARGGMSAAVMKASGIEAKNKNAYMPGQFKNPSNPQAHFKTTAPEIWEQTDGKIDILVAGVGTGGTITGCAHYLKDKNPNIKIVAVEPTDSAVLSGGKPGPHTIQGIGAGFIPEVLDMSVIDEIIQVKNDEAIEMARDFAKKEGILGGISSGANLFAACQLAMQEENAGKNIVTFVCDTGERYLSTEMFD